eukprot:Nk52_evm20s2118 gene=Nk52_evmTU20s2118
MVADYLINDASTEKSEISSSKSPNKLTQSSSSSSSSPSSQSNNHLVSTAATNTDARNSQDCIKSNKGNDSLSTKQYLGYMPFKAHINPNVETSGSADMQHKIPPAFAKLDSMLKSMLIAKHKAFYQDRLFVSYRASKPTDSETELSADVSNSVDNQLLLKQQQALSRFPDMISTPLPGIPVKGSSPFYNNITEETKSLKRNNRTLKKRTSSWNMYRQIIENGLTLDERTGVTEQGTASNKTDSVEHSHKEMNKSSMPKPPESPSPIRKNISRPHFPAHNVFINVITPQPLFSTEELLYRGTESSSLASISDTRFTSTGKNTSADASANADATGAPITNDIPKKNIQEKTPTSEKVLIFQPSLSAD